MSGRSWLALIIGVVGILAIIVGIIYMTTPAHSLPSFFPGHLAHAVGKRTKRGVTALVVGAVLIIVGAVLAMSGPDGRLRLRGRV